MRSGKRAIFQSVPFPPAPKLIIPIQMKSCTDGTIALSEEAQGSKPILSESADFVNRDFCEFVYPNEVALRIGANLTLDMLRTLIALNPLTIFCLNDVSRLFFIHILQICAKVSINSAELLPIKWE